MRIAVLVVAVLAWAAAAQAQTAPVDWQAQWQATIKAANQEGAVVCGCPQHPGSRQFLTARWHQDYPDIKLDYTPASLPEWAARINAERDAGKFLWDVYFSGPGPEIYRMAHDKTLDPLLPSLILPDVKDPATWGGWENAFYDNAHASMLSFWTQLTMPYYNAKFVPPDQAAKLGMKVVLDPAYKGKTVWWDPRFGGAGSNFAYFILLKFGKDALKTALVDQAPIFVRDANAIAERMVRGTAVLSLGPDPYEALAPYRKAGVPFDIRPLGFTADVASLSTQYGIAAVINRPPNPNAAKLFINWLLSKPIQEALGNAVKVKSRRVDVPAPEGAPPPPIAGEKYIELQKEEYIADRGKAMRLAKELRPQ